MLQRVQAGWDAEKEEPVVKFSGWARMALPLAGFDIIEVRPPKVGEAKPAAVVADVVVNTMGAPACKPDQGHHLNENLNETAH